MALIPQDATGTVVGANAYITEDWYTAYHAERGNAQPATPRCSIPEAIIQATEFIDLAWASRWPTYVLVDGQATAWPRYSLGLPLNLQKATAELALRARSAPLSIDLAPTADPDQVVKRLKEKVGPLEEETEYATGADAPAARQGFSYPIVEMLLASLFAPWKQGGTYR